MKKFFPILKTAINVAYPPSLVITAFALFRYAYIAQLNPGFELMSFAMKFFVGIFLCSTGIFFVVVLLKSFLESKKNK